MRETKKISVATKRVNVRFPKEQIARFDAEIKAGKYKSRAQCVHDYLIRGMFLELAPKLRKGTLSQGKAAELLGIDRWHLMDLMGEYEVPMTQPTAAELDRELKSLREYRREKRSK